MESNNGFASEELMTELKTAGHDSICYVLSKIYFSVEDESIKLNLRKAVWMAKRMGAKLKLIRAEKRAEQVKIMREKMKHRK